MHVTGPATGTTYVAAWSERNTDVFEADTTETFAPGAFCWQKVHSHKVWLCKIAEHMQKSSADKGLWKAGSGNLKGKTKISEWTLIL